ncbi:MAG: hypothetical protein AcusKO_18740 [Acuticoccus sp.]
MHVDDRFLRPQVAHAEDVARDDHAELHEHHEEQKPANGFAQYTVDGVDGVGEEAASALTPWALCGGEAAAVAQRWSRLEDERQPPIFSERARSSA